MQSCSASNEDAEPVGGNPQLQARQAETQEDPGAGRGRRHRGTGAEPTEGGPRPRADEQKAASQADAGRKKRARGRKQEFAIVVGNTTTWGKKASHYMLAAEADAFVCIETHVKSGAVL